MAWWNKNKNKNQIEQRQQTLEEVLLGMNSNTYVSKLDSLNIPTLSGCLEIITNTVASVPIYLYEEKEGKVGMVEDDRTKLLNDDTRDHLDGFQFKKILTESYLINGAGYALINRDRNKVISLHYINYDYVSIQVGTDPIFKTYNILVNGESIGDFEMIKILRKTKNGITGHGIINESNKILSVMYNALIFEQNLMSTGGQRKGYIKSQGRLSAESMQELKNAWQNLYKGNSTDSVLILNNGLDFAESSSTATELQMNEQKKTNANEICKLFLVPPSILEGKATDEEYNNFLKICIVPILTAIETALNKDLLLPSEKGKYYFAFDYSELVKASDMESRFKAYEIACKNSIMSIDEIRYRENLEPLNLEFVKLNLADVLLDTRTKTIFTPNTGQQTNMTGQQNEIVNNSQEQTQANPLLNANNQM